MSFSRRLAENIYKNPTPEEIEDTKDHVRNVQMVMGGCAIFLSDAALAISADSWQADVLAVPTGIAALALVSKGIEGHLRWSRSGPNQDSA